MMKITRCGRECGNHLGFGLAMDVALAVVAVTRPHWAQQLIAGVG